MLRIDDPDDFALNRMPRAAPVQMQPEEVAEAKIEAATFTGKGNHDVVSQLSMDYRQRFKSVSWRADRWVACDDRVGSSCGLRFERR